ncbi:tetratricopeptide repeat protein, partial [Solirubrobacter soli]|uniref:tetratricopeptide repeat protein n=1 Tax=Solirubrobacter soli TaxID=363832 RepID=UPI0012F8B2C6
MSGTDQSAKARFADVLEQQASNPRQLLMAAAASGAVSVAGLGLVALVQGWLNPVAFLVVPVAVVCVAFGSTLLVAYRRASPRPSPNVSASGPSASKREDSSHGAGAAAARAGDRDPELASPEVALARASVPRQPSETAPRSRAVGAFASEQHEIETLEAWFNAPAAERVGLIGSPMAIRGLRSSTVDESENVLADEPGEAAPLVGEEALTYYGEIVARLRNAPEVSARELARALRKMGVAFGDLRRHEDELAVYDEVVARFGDASDGALREEVAMALVNKGVALGELNRLEEEVAVYDEVVDRFGDSSDVALQKQAAMAAFNKGVVLGDLNRPADQLDAYDDVVTRFGKESDLALRESVAQALLNRAAVLGTLNRHDDALVAYDVVVDRVGDATEPELREQAAMALANKGFEFGRLGHFVEALATYGEVIDRFGEATEPELREQVA